MAKATLLYDADCGFCRWTLALILEWDRAGRLRPLALQDPEADRLLGEAVSADLKMESFHLVTSSGEVYSRGSALTKLATLLPGGGPIASLMARVPRVVDRGYFWVARNRGIFGRTIGRIGHERAKRVIAERGGATGAEGTSCKLPRRQTA
jgi:predicted DCC family thiol-disulfide oxidoreductase YuxK